MKDIQKFKGANYDNFFLCFKTRQNCKVQTLTAANSRLGFTVFSVLVYYNIIIQIKWKHI